jgi:hypothetical protein
MLTDYVMCILFAQVSQYLTFTVYHIYPKHFWQSHIFIAK